MKPKRHACKGMLSCGGVRPQAPSFSYGVSDCVSAMVLRVVAWLGQFPIFPRFIDRCYHLVHRRQRLWVRWWWQRAPGGLILAPQDMHAGQRIIGYRRGLVGTKLGNALAGGQAA